MRPETGLLFTDADVVFRADALRRAVVYAEREKADHVVLFPTMVMKSVGERMMMAFFQSQFVFAHRPWKVCRPEIARFDRSGGVQPDSSARYTSRLAPTSACGWRCSTT